MMIAFIRKVVQKSPLAYPLARSLVCLSPMSMNAHPEESKKLFRRVLLILVEKGKLGEASRDQVETDFAGLVADACDAEKGKDFRQFDWKSDRLDVFLSERAKGYPSAWGVLRALKPSVAWTSDSGAGLLIQQRGGC